MTDTHESNDSLEQQDASQPIEGNQEAKAPDAPTGDANEESPEEGASEEPKKVPFRELPLCDAVQDGLDAMGFEMATPIQSLAIPPTTEGKDVIGIAQTGTGKTAAFLLPTMHNIYESGGGDHIKCLIITPTRELALQIDQACEGFGYFSGTSSVAIYGGGSGSDFDREKNALTTGVDIAIVTPGRMLSHMNLGYVDLSKIDVLILDEADRMLDMGFLGDINRITEHCNPDRQTLLYSATMPERINKLATTMLKDPVTVQIALSRPAEKVMQVAYPVHDDQKPKLLVSLLKDRGLESVIVFSSRKRSISIIARSLSKAGLNVGSISSDLDQKDREDVMRRFRNRKVHVLVATDVVSRGIDIDNIEMVINYDVPPNEEDYVHRIGRTARAGRGGIGITLITPGEMRNFSKIEKLIQMEVRKEPLPKELGEGPAYDPNAPSHRGGRSGGGGGRHGGGRGGNRHGGGRSGGGRGRDGRKGGGGGRPEGNRSEGRGGQGSEGGNRNKGRNGKRRSGGGGQGSGQNSGGGQNGGGGPSGNPS
jgi:ATP-dependent RNA helicase RhlE